MSDWRRPFSWRFSRPLGLVTLALVVVGACQQDPLVPTAGTKFVSQTIAVQARNDVDLLFVVDDSSGTADKQKALIAAFPSLTRALQASGAALPGLHVGVVSSNLGAPASRLAECAASDRGALQSPASACAAAAQGRYLVSLDGGSRNNFPGAITDAFACMAALGTAGCGFEQHLGSAKRAFDGDQPLENDGFLRSEALLGLMVLADEDDCSAPAATDLFEPATTRYGPQKSFRCNQFGHRCGGVAPSGAQTGALTCRSAEGDGKLTPVADFVSFFKSLKAQPEQVLVSVLAGPPTPYVVRTIDGEAEITPSCQSATGPAAPAVRLAEFAAGFGTRGFFSSICDDDLGPALDRFGTAIARQLGASCLTAAPVKSKTDAGDGTPDCRVTQKPAGLGADRALPACTTAGPRPCWSITAAPERCESGVEMRIDSGETGFLPGTTVTALCRVCTARTDARCR